MYIEECANYKKHAFFEKFQIVFPSKPTKNMNYYRNWKISLLSNRIEAEFNADQMKINLHCEFISNTFNRRDGNN